MPPYKHPKEKNLSPHFASPYIFHTSSFLFRKCPTFSFTLPLATNKKSFEFLKRLSLGSELGGQSQQQLLPTPTLPAPFFFFAGKVGSANVSQPQQQKKAGKEGLPL